MSVNWTDNPFTDPAYPTAEEKPSWGSPATETGPAVRGAGIGMGNNPDLHRPDTDFREEPEETSAPAMPAAEVAELETSEAAEDSGAGDLSGWEDLFPDLEDLPAANLSPVPQEAELPAAVELPAEPAAVPQPAEASLPATRDHRNELVAARRAARAAEQGSESYASAPQVDPAVVEAYQRYALAEQLKPYVTAIREAAGASQISKLDGGFRLTRDKTLDAEQRASFEAKVAPLLAMQKQPMPQDPTEAKIAFDLAYDETIGIGPLGPLWRDDDVTEIIVSGPDKVTCEKNGVLLPVPVRFESLKDLQGLARTMARALDDRSLSRSSPLVTAQLPRARVQFVYEPVAATAGCIVDIRKFREQMSMRQLLEFSAISDEMVAFISDAVLARANILVSGGTGTGKTTMLNAASEFIPENERVVTIENALELHLSNQHVETLVSKQSASADDEVIITQEDLVETALRLRPDRIVVGEIRVPSECVVVLTAANTGHDGTMTTVHANDPEGAVGRLTLLRQLSSSNITEGAARREVAGAFDIVVQLRRRRGRRFVSHVAVIDPETGNTTNVFTGTLPSGATDPVYTKVAGLSPDTDLMSRFEDAGIDASRWAS